LALGLLATSNSPCRAQSIDELQELHAGTQRVVQKLDKADTALLRLLTKIPLDFHGYDFPVATVESLLKGWRSYTTLECGLIGHVTGGKMIAKGQFVEMCLERRYSARLEVVAGASACISAALKKAPEEQPGPDCLEALTPLKLDADFQA
jgi:hypothetical protein